MKGRSLSIGATATHAMVANSPIVGEAIPALAELASLIGDPDEPTPFAAWLIVSCPLTMSGPFEITAVFCRQTSPST